MIEHARGRCAGRACVGPWPAAGRHDPAGTPHGHKASYWSTFTAEDRLGDTAMWRKRSEHHPPFTDRVDAGRKLADALAPLVTDVPRQRLIALGLARGGVVLAAEVSRMLGIAMDALVVRK